MWRDADSRPLRRAALLAAVLWCAMAGLAVAQSAHEIAPAGADAERQVERYHITIGPGGALWDVGFNRLPMLALEQGEQRVMEIVEGAFRRQYAARGSGEVRAGDSFTIEVPAGTFVTRSIDRQPDRVVYEAFNGDKLTTFQREPSVAYRLLRVSDSAHAEVLMYGGQADAVAQARLVYDVDRPDFIQVRTVRGALLERQSKLTVDLGRKYQDEFRNFRDRAARVEDLPERGKAYTFDAAAVDIPFVRVEDAVGDETEPGKFPRVFRTAFYRDGTVRRYVVTEAGDALGTLARPDSAAWSAVLPQHREWLPGQAETLPPFTPAISGSGALLPGRILVLAYRPRLVQPSPRPTASTSDAAAGLECLGVPLAALFAALGWVARVRPGA